MKTRKILVVVFVAGIAVSSRADFMTGFLGNTRPEGDTMPGFGGSVSFAVLDRTGGTPNDPYGIGSGLLESRFLPGEGSEPWNPSPRFLYLFQVVNDGMDDTALGSFRFPFSASDVANAGSYGTFTGLGFADFEGEVGPGNPLGRAGDFGNPAAANIGAIEPGIVDLSQAPNPGLNNGFPSWNDVASPEYTWTVPKLEPGQRSLLFGLTTDAAPSYNVFLDLLSGDNVGQFAGGTIVSPRAVPEPYSLLLGSTGLLIGAGWFALRSRSSSARPSRADSDASPSPPPSR
jgi:hypothetical protein